MILMVWSAEISWNHLIDLLDRQPVAQSYSISGQDQESS